jgi:predicted nucleotidyltransferase
MINKNIQPLLKDLKLGLSDLYKNELDKIILFGSYAHGDEKSDSDIDVLIHLKNHHSFSNEVKKTLHFVYQLNLKHDKVISVFSDSVSDYKNLISPFYVNVKKEGVVL